LEYITVKQDLLEGRLGQPKGRGAIGRIISLGANASGTPGAVVDFGRGYAPDINLTELSPVSILP
jgi:hypothetical protein